MHRFWFALLSLLAMAFMPPTASAAPVRQGFTPAPNQTCGMAVADDGALWIADDRNGAVIRIARDELARTKRPTD